MPTELFRIDSGLSWLRATVRPLHNFLETVLYFDLEGKQLSIAFNALPNSEFFETLPHVRSLSIREFSKEERGWVEHGRFRVSLNDDDDYDAVHVASDYVRWGPREESCEE